ncbi:shikimate kinase [[Clostridium] cellulosi]
MKNIFLCGFMGCGKSTVGAELSSLLSMKFIDMDKYIEQKVGKTIPEIFEKYGEKRFREYERTAAAELASKSGLVVATGGGAVLSDKNTAAFKSGGIIVFIDVPLEVIAKRLEGDTSRPLLQREDKFAALRELYEKRMPFYRKAADLIVSNNDNAPAVTVAQKIASSPKIKKLLG